MENDKYGLHAILIPHDSTPEHVNDICEKFLGNKKRIYKRLTKNKIRIRNIPKTKFEKKSFKSKPLNDGTTLVYGRLKPEYEHLQGKGIFDSIKNIANKGINLVKDVSSKAKDIVTGDLFRRDLKNYTNESQKTLEKYGNRVIQALTICRRPIPAGVKVMMNVMSLGKFDKLQKQAGYDDLYHLYLVADVGSAKIIIEKNERINISDNFSESSNTQRMPVNLNGQQITLDQFILNGQKMVSDNVEWFGYDSLTRNCQYFIRWLLLGNNLLTPENEKFTFQDKVKEWTKELPSYVGNIAKFATDTAGVVSKLLGRGRDERAKRLLALECLENDISINPKHKKMIKLGDHKFSPKDIYDEMQKIRMLR